MRRNCALAALLVLVAACGMECGCRFGDWGQRPKEAPVGALGVLNPRSHELVLGVPGSGKTHYARERVASARRVVFFDPSGDGYFGQGESVSPAELRHVPELYDGRWCRLVVIAGDGDAEIADEFRAVVAACRAAARGGGLVLVADEVGDYGRSCDRELTALHRNGHHDGVASILVSQCAVDIPKTCRRTATRVTSLLQTDAGDLEALAEQYGQPFADRARAWRPGSAPVVWELPTLHPLQETSA